MCYMDEDTGVILLTDMYLSNNILQKTGTIYNRCFPSLPGTISGTQAFWNLQTGAYNIIGNIQYPPYTANKYFAPQSPILFDPQQMAVNASF